MVPNYNNTNPRCDTSVSMVEKRKDLAFLIDELNGLIGDNESLIIKLCGVKDRIVGSEPSAPQDCKTPQPSCFKSLLELCVDRARRNNAELNAIIEKIDIF